MRKPLVIGLGPVMGPGWTPRLFTHKGAQRFMDSWAKRSNLWRVGGCVGLVADLPDYWRGNVAAQPMERGAQS